MENSQYTEVNESPLSVAPQVAPQELTDTQVEPEKVPVKTLPLSNEMVESIEAINAEFKRLSDSLNMELQIMMKGYVMALNLDKDQVWQISKDFKSIEVYEK